MHISFYLIHIMATMDDVERLPQHRHCYVCGKAHTEEGRFCSESCKDKKRIELKKKKRQYLILEIVLVIVTIAAILTVM